MFLTDGEFWIGIGTLISAITGSAWFVYKVVPRLSRREAKKTVRKDYDEQNAEIRALRNEMEALRRYQEAREESWASERREMHAERKKLLKTISEKDEIIIKQQGEITRLKTRYKK